MEGMAGQRADGRNSVVFNLLRMYEMKTRFIAFSVFTAVGICFSASQSRADEPCQPNEITQPLAEPSAGNKVTVDLAEEPTASGAWTAENEGHSESDVKKAIKNGAEITTGFERFWFADFAQLRPCPWVCPSPAV